MMTTTTPIPDNLSRSLSKRAHTVHHPPQHAPEAPEAAEVEDLWGDPAAWSVLHRTLPDLFGFCIPSLEQGDDHLPTVGELGLAADDVERLRSAAIFPEESAAVLATVSAGYLLQAGVTDAAFAIILDRLAQADAGGLSSAKIPTPTNKVSDAELYGDLQPPPPLPVPGFRHPELLPAAAGQSPVMWQEVAKITERTVIERLVFGRRALECIKHLWHLKGMASLLLNGATTGIPATAYRDFYDLADAYLLVGTVPSSDRHAEKMYRLMKAHLCHLGGSRPTLRQLAQQEQLSRERIRQILAKTTAMLGTPSLLDRLRYLWMWVDEFLDTGGGVLCAKEMTESLTNALRWPVSPPEEIVVTFVCLSPRYQRLGHGPLGVAQAGHGCVACPEMRSALSTAVATCSELTLPLNAALLGLRESCREKRCPGFGKVSRFSAGVIAVLAKGTEGLSSNDSSIYAVESPGTGSSAAVEGDVRKKARTGRAILERIVGAAGQPVGVEEICQQLLTSGRPEERIRKARWAGRELRCSPMILPWGRKYVHRDALPLLATVVREIESELVVRFASDGIPYLSISGIIFKKYGERLWRETIDTPVGLYTCLAHLSSPALLYPEYPYVLSKEGEGVRRPVPLVLKDYLIGQNGPVAIDEIMRFCSEKLCLNKRESRRAIQRIPDCVKPSRFTVLHVPMLGMEAGALAPVVEFLTRHGERNRIGAGELYEANSVLCCELGIPTPVHLYHLINRFYPGRFSIMRRWHVSARARTVDLPVELPDIEVKALAPIVAFLDGRGEGCRIAASTLYRANHSLCRELDISTPVHLYYLIERFYPRRFHIIRRWEIAPPPARTGARPAPAALGISALTGQLLSYLKEQDGPCPIRKAAEAVRGATGKASYLGTLDSRFLLRHTLSTLVTRESLNWNHEKQLAIEELAARHLEERERQGKAFGNCSHILREMGSRLPEIGETVSWTAVLIHELLGSGTRFLALGKVRDLYVAADNRHGIATLNDLAYHILLTEFGGAAPEFVLIAELDKLGIRQRWDKYRSGHDPRIIRTGKIVHVAGCEVPPELMGWKAKAPRDRRMTTAAYDAERKIVAGQIVRLLDEHGITIRAAAMITGSGHADFSSFRHGRFRGATLDRLERMLGKLEQHVERHEAR